MSQFALSNNRGILELLHNSFRFGGVNEPIEEGVASSEFDSESLNANYFFGLFSSVVIMGIFTLIWLCVLPCVTCCCREKCCKNLFFAKVFFFFCMFWSILGFLISTGGVGDFDEGASGGFDTLLSFADEVIDATNALEDLVNVDIVGLQTLIDDANVQCGGEGTFQGNLPDANDFTVGLDTSDVVGFFGDFDVQVSDAQEIAEVFIDPLESGLNLTIALYLIYLFIFVIVTAVAFTYDSQKAAGKPVDSSSCMGKTSDCNKSVGCPLFMCCGILIALSTVSTAGVIGILATAGADQCVPSIREDILAIVSGDLQPDINQMCGLNDLDAADDQELLEYFTCHYLTCEGNDLFLEAIGIAKNVVNGEVELSSVDLDNIIAQIQDEINATLGQVGQQCADSLDALLTQALLVVSNGLELFEFVTCDNITPFWIELLDETLCNELFAGLGVIYVSWLLGAISLMFALCAYPAIVLAEQSPKAPLHVQPVGVVQEAKVVEAVPAAEVKGV